MFRKINLILMMFLVLSISSSFAQEGKVTVRDWNGSLEALNESLKRVYQNNQALSAQIEILNAEVDKLQAQTDELDTHAVDDPGNFAFNNKKEVEVFQKEADRVYQNLKDIAKERQELEVRLIEKNKEMVQLKADIDSLYKIVAGLKEKIQYSSEGKDPDIERQKKDLNSWISETEKSCNKAQNELAALRKKNTVSGKTKKLEKRKIELQNKLEKLKQEIAVLQENQQVDAGSLKLEQEYQDKISSISENISKLEKRRDELNGVLDHIAEKLDKNNFHLDQENVDVKELEHNLKVLKDENIQLKNDFNRLQK
ncbi:MAG: hypothetical protein HQL25_05395 [Candidatus Omnitrophica bacterium]|nr:hypothetical protein [Candidatus Omnitrophota bacterium]